MATPAKNAKVNPVSAQTQSERLGDSHKKSASHDISGAEIVIRCLNAEKVKFVFGYPGGNLVNSRNEQWRR